MTFEIDAPTVKTSEQLKEDIVFEATLRGHRMTFHSTWGLFSPKCIDDGSALLLAHLDIADSQRTLDLGCGYGALGLTIAKSCPGGHVHLVDKDFVAVDFTRKNAEANRLSNCSAYLSNGFSAVEETTFDTIVANLPAKVGRELLYILLSDAKDHLKPGGQLVVVTISGLRDFVKKNFQDIFGNCSKVKQGRGHTVAKAVREG